jgi:hypothetical protein
MVHNNFVVLNEICHRFKLMYVLIFETCCILHEVFRFVLLHCQLVFYLKKGTTSVKSKEASRGEESNDARITAANRN